MDSVVDYIIRPLYPEEIHLLRDFLYEAIFIPEGVEPLPRDVVDLPELKLYIQDFGKKQDDCCLVVEYDGKVVGAVWTRIMNDYGHVDDETPSLSISLYKEYRNKGMGRQLMKEMMKLLESKGYHHVSLSVQKANYAVRMYLKLGFTIMKETEEEFIMVRDITKEASNYQRFLSGEYCNRLDSEVLNMIIQTRELLSMLDNITLSEEERTALFVRMLGKVGQHSSIGRNFTCQCGKHIFIGEKTIINDNCTLMDENYIYIGSKVLIAPHVQFYTATHPVCFEERFVEDWNENSGELFFRTKALPITVEDEVWIGGGSIVLAGVTIGRGSVIGAGSVVTKSIPAHCVAVGNPCKVIKWLKPNYNIRPLEEKDILEGIVRFGNIDAVDIIRPRINVIAIDGSSSYQQVKEIITEHGYSRMPVYEENLDNITGILYVKDLLQHLDEKEDFHWQTLIRPAYFVPETKKINDLLEEFQTKKVHLAIVVDEYGGTTGIVTMEDIIEEIVGDINDEYDEQEIVYTRDKNGAYIFEASTLLNDFYKITDIEEDSFQEVEGDADTLAGLILEIKGELPHKDEVITYKEHQFKVLEVDNRRIKKIQYKKIENLEAKTQN